MVVAVYFVIIFGWPYRKVPTQHLYTNRCHVSTRHLSVDWLDACVKVRVLGILAMAMIVYCSVYILITIMQPPRIARL